MTKYIRATLEDAKATVKHQILNGYINVYGNQEGMQQSILDAILEPHVLWAIKMLVDKETEQHDTGES